MWLSRLLPLVLVAACGYAPALAPGGLGGQLIGKVDLAAPSDRNSYDLTNALEDRLGAPGAGAYLLTTTVEVSEEVVGITRQQEVQRYNLRGTARYVLTNPATGETLLEGSVADATAYFTTDTAVSTRAAQLDANKRLMTLLAEDIFARLVASGLFEG